MESPFEILLERVRAVRAAMPEILKDSVNEAAPVIEDKIIEQLERGERGDGSILPDYSPVSVQVYGKRPGPMTMRDTGNFHRAITVRANDNGVEITNPDWKSAMLEMTYGPHLIAIQDQSFNELKPEILNDNIRHRIDKILNQ